MGGRSDSFPAASIPRAEQEGRLARTHKSGFESIQASCRPLPYLFTTARSRKGRRSESKARSSRSRHITTTGGRSKPAVAPPRPQEHQEKREEDLD